MGGIPERTGGTTLALDEGSPSPQRAIGARKMDRWITLGFLALAMGATAVTAARVADPVVGSGAVTENPGGVVLKAEVGGVAGQDGIRAGQEVVALRRADEPGGWRIVTLASDGGQVVSRGAPHERKLSAAWPLVIGAFVASALSVVLVRRRPRESEMASATAVLLAAGPWSITAGTAMAGIVLPAAMLLPAAWLARWSGRGLIGWLPLGAAAVLAAAWLVLQATASPLFDPADQVRFGLTVLLAGVVLLVALARRPAPGAGWLADPQTSTVVSLAILVGTGVGLAIVVRVPWPAVLASAAVAMASFPVLRRVVGAAIDRLLFAEIRARSAAAAVESEPALPSAAIRDMDARADSTAAATTTTTPTDHNRQLQRQLVVLIQLLMAQEPWLPVPGLVRVRDLP